MRVTYLLYDHLGHFRPIETAIGLRWRRIMGGTEIKPVRSIQVQGKQPFQIAGEFMATPRQKTEVFQGCRSVEIVEPPADALRPFRSVLPNKQFPPVADFTELLRTEPDFHCIRLRKTIHQNSECYFTMPQNRAENNLLLWDATLRLLSCSLGRYRFNLMVLTRGKLRPGR